MVRLRSILNLAFIFATATVSGCRDSGPDDAAVSEPWTARYDPDVDIYAPPGSIEAIAPDIPAHDAVEDCNENGIDDAYDRAGYVPRGPYSVGGSPTLIRSAAPVPGATGRHEVVVVTDDSPEASITLFRSNRTHRLEQLLSLVDGIAPGASDLHVADIDDDDRRDMILSHHYPIPAADGSYHEPNHYLTVALRRSEGVDDGTDYLLQTRPLVSDDDGLQNAPVHSLEVIEGSGATVIAASGNVASSGGSGRNEGAVTQYTGGNLDLPNQYHFSADLYLYSSVLADFDGDGIADYCVATSRGILLCVPASTDATFVERIRAGVKFKYEDVLPAGFSTASDERRALIAATISEVPDGGSPGVDLVAATTDGIAIIPNRHNGDFGYCEATGDPDEGLFDTEGYCRVLANRMFDEPVTIDLGGAAKQLASVDLDGDGDNDLVATIPFNNEVVLLWNRSGSFLYPRSGRPRATRLPVSGRPWSLAAADIDDDGRVEIVIGNTESDDVWVLHQRDEPLPMMAECPPRIFMEGGPNLPE